MGWIEILQRSSLLPHRGVLSFRSQVRELWDNTLLRSSTMKRREFFALLGGAIACPLAARAQQPRLPTIGYLGATASSASEERPRLAVLVQRLKELGWIEGRTVGIEYRWAGGHSERFTDFAAEFARLKADLIVTYSTAAVIAVKQITSAIPIVFAGVADPVGTGIVASLARPGGNATGVSLQRYRGQTPACGLRPGILCSCVRSTASCRPAGRARSRRP